MPGSDKFDSDVEELRKQFWSDDAGDKADAKPRGEDLGERADVDDGSAWSALASGSTGRPS